MVPVGRLTIRLSPQTSTEPTHRSSSSLVAHALSGVFTSTQESIPVQLLFFMFYVFLRWVYQRNESASYCMATICCYFWTTLERRRCYRSRRCFCKKNKGKYEAFLLVIPFPTVTLMFFLMNFVVGSYWSADLPSDSSWHSCWACHGTKLLPTRMATRLYSSVDVLRKTKTKPIKAVW